MTFSVCGLLVILLCSMLDSRTRSIAAPSMMWDEHAQANHMYFLNSEYMGFVIHSRRNFVMTPFTKPHNQDAKTAQMLFAGNMTCSNCRFQGVLDVSGITYS